MEHDPLTCEVCHGDPLAAAVAAGGVALKAQAAGLRAAWKAEQELADHRSRQLVAAEAERDRAVEARENANAATLRAEAERDRYCRIGDRMQSEASRLAEWARTWAADVPMSYEVRQALGAVEGCVRDWTAARVAATTERTDLDAA